MSDFPSGKLERGKILTGPADNVHYSVTKKEQAITVTHHNIARMEPATIPGSIGCIRIFQISAEKSETWVITSAAHE